MKTLLFGLTLLISLPSLASGDFSCFSTYTDKQFGMVEEQAFKVNKRDRRLDSDGYITSINLQSLLDEGSAKIEVNFGLGILNKGKTMEMVFKPVYSENPFTEERILNNVTVEVAETSISVPLVNKEVTTIEFPVRFEEEEKRVKLECGLINF